MSDDLVKRLNEYSLVDGADVFSVDSFPHKEALARIEALTADLREAENRANAFATKEMHTAAERDALAEKLARAGGALEPFALVSSEGVVRQAEGLVKLTTCAEYYHHARTTLAAIKEGGE